MRTYLLEFIGTAILVLLGNGVMASIYLDKTKGKDEADLIAIAAGWGVALFIALSIVGDYRMLNPVAAIISYINGSITFITMILYTICEMLGAMFGQLLVYIVYKKQYDATEDEKRILATFSTMPEIKDPVYNMISSIIMSFILFLAMITLEATPPMAGILIFGIGISLGGPIGYTINPARDLGPRILHEILPIKYKDHSDWKYAYIPVLGPIIGGLLAMVVSRII